MDRILGCGPAGLRRGRGPLGKCSSCDVLPANLKVKVGGDEMETESHGWGGAEEKCPGGAASGRGGMRGGRRRREAATEGQAVWRGTNALWVCDDAAVDRGGGEGTSGMARDLGEAVCEAVCGWARRRRRTKRRD